MVTKSYCFEFGLFEFKICLGFRASDFNKKQGFTLPNRAVVLDYYIGYSGIGVNCIEPI